MKLIELASYFMRPFKSMLTKIISRCTRIPRRVLSSTTTSSSSSDTPNKEVAKDPKEDEEYVRVISRLEGVTRFRLHQTRTLKKTIVPTYRPDLYGRGARTGGAIVRSEMTLVDRDSSVEPPAMLLRLEYSRGITLEDFGVTVYSSSIETSPPIATMFLKRSLRYRALVLRVCTPLEVKYASVYELPGVSHVAMIKSSNDSRTFLQILADGNIGWATRAKILTADGGTAIGSFERHVPVSRTGKRAKRQLTADIDLKKGDLLGGKKIICIIGGAIMMMCRYEF